MVERLLLGIERLQLGAHVGLHVAAFARRGHEKRTERVSSSRAKADLYIYPLEIELVKFISETD